MAQIILIFKIFFTLLRNCCYLISLIQYEKSPFVYVNSSHCYNTVGSAYS